MGPISAHWAGDAFSLAVAVTAAAIWIAAGVFIVLHIASGNREPKQ